MPAKIGRKALQVGGYWRIGDVALHFGVHVNTIRRWHAEGLLVPVVVVNGQRRYDVNDIIKFDRKMKKRVKSTRVV